MAWTTDEAVALEGNGQAGETSEGGPDSRDGTVSRGDSPGHGHSRAGGGPASELGVQGGRSRFEAEGMEFSSGHVTFEAPGSSLSAGRRKKDWGSEHGLRREKGLDSNPLLPLVRYRTEPLPQALKLRFLTCKTGTTADHRMGLL